MCRSPWGGRCQLGNLIRSSETPGVKEDDVTLTTCHCIHDITGESKILSWGTVGCEYASMRCKEMGCPSGQPIGPLVATRKQRSLPAMVKHPRDH